MRAVAVAHLRNAKTWHTWGRELRLRIAQTNLLGQRHLAECILDALLDGLGTEGIGGYKKCGLGLIGINHYLLRHNSSGQCGQEDGYCMTSVHTGLRRV